MAYPVSCCSGGLVGVLAVRHPYACVSYGHFLHQYLSFVIQYTHQHEPCGPTFMCRPIWLYPAYTQRIPSYPCVYYFLYQYPSFVVTILTNMNQMVLHSCVGRFGHTRRIPWVYPHTLVFTISCTNIRPLSSLYSPI